MVLTGQAAQQDEIGRQKRDIERGAMLAAEPPQPVAQLGWQNAMDGGVPRALHFNRCGISGQFQRGMVVTKRLLPIGKLLLASLTPQPFALLPHVSEIAL